MLMKNDLIDGNEHTKCIFKKYPNEKIITICADFEDQLEPKEDEKSKFMKDTGLEKLGD